MSRIEKLLRKFLKNPESLKFKEIEKLLLYIGFEKIGINGSHHLFIHPLDSSTHSIPVHNSECKTVYKKKTCKLVHKLLQNENYNGFL